MTAGICPVTMCAKGLFNGPCIGTNKGSCEINSDPACAVESRLKTWSTNRPSPSTWPMRWPAFIKTGNDFPVCYQKCKADLKFVCNLPVDTYKADADRVRSRFMAAEGSSEAVDDDFDLVVLTVGIMPAANPVNTALAEMLNIDVGSMGFLQIDKVQRFPVCTNRAGIFGVGGSRRVKKRYGALMDAKNAAIRVRSFLGDGTITVPADRAVLDTGKCTFCLTCSRCCPHGAICWSADNKPVISAAACQGCGICKYEKGSL